MHFKADLHIHSCLSPCGDLEMGPEAVIAKVISEGLTHIALTDHNSTRNCRAFQYHALKAGLRFIPGIEITSTEEAHILCYFPTLEQAEACGTFVESTLLPLPLPENVGEQIVVNSDEEIEEMIDDCYLSVASGLSIDEIMGFKESYGAIIIPAHVDKPVFSIISQLGFVPDEGFAALEVSTGGLKRGADQELIGFPVICASDAHFIENIGDSYWEGEIENAESLLDSLHSKKWNLVTR